MPISSLRRSRALRAAGVLTTLTLSAALTVPVLAQTNPTAATLTQPLDASNVPAGKLLVPERLPVKLILDEDLKSGTAKVGDEIEYETATDLYTADRQLICPAGTKAYGQVLKSSGHGMFGKPGKLEISADYVLTPDRTKIPLRGSQVGGGGKNETVGMVAMTALISVFGVFVQGRDMTLHKGTEVPMYVNQDTVVTPYMTAMQGGGGPQYPMQQPLAGSPLTLANQGMQPQSAPRWIYTMMNGQQVVGEQTAFDGSTYAVKTDNGVRLIKATSLRGTPVPASKMLYTLRDGSTVVGVQSAFDGTTYAVVTDSGVRLIKASDVKSVYQLVSPGGAPNAPAQGMPQVITTNGRS